MDSSSTLAAPSPLVSAGDGHDEAAAGVSAPAMRMEFLPMPALSEDVLDDMSDEELDNTIRMLEHIASYQHQVLLELELRRDVLRNLVSK